MAETKLKIGDTVIVKAALYGHEFEIGEAVTVSIFEDDGSIACINSKGIQWHLEEVELGTPLEAAAPAMYELLERLSNYLHSRGYEQWPDEIEQVLSLARGETELQALKDKFQEKVKEALELNSKLGRQ